MPHGFGRRFAPTPNQGKRTVTVKNAPAGAVSPLSGSRASKIHIPCFFARFNRHPRSRSSNRIIDNHFFSFFALFHSAFAYVQNITTRCWRLRRKRSFCNPNTKRRPARAAVTILISIYRAAATPAEPYRNLPRCVPPHSPCSRHAAVSPTPSPPPTALSP